MNHKFARILVSTVLSALFTANAHANRACCFPDATCAMVANKIDVAAQCTDLDGVIQERGVTCADNPCEIFCEDAEVTCDDGLDNDCDGLVDAEDPDCGGDGCPEGFPDRMPSQVIDDLLGAIAAGDEALIACNFHADVRAISDQGICFGSTDLAGFLLSKRDAFGAGITVNSSVVTGNLVRLLYSVEGNGIAINDGVETYVIDEGRVQFYSDHGTLSVQ